jgi:L-amino acid N-acyltransferase YncA
MGSPVGRAIRVLRDEGLRSFWFKLLAEVGYRRVLLLERPLEKPIPDVKPGVPVTIDLLKGTEVDEYLAFRTEVDPSIVEGWLDAGNQCFVARYEGQIVSASWAAVHWAVWIYYLACEIRLERDEVYVYGSFTSPDFRGKSISPAIRAEMMRRFRAVGYRRMVLWIEPENKSSLRTVWKVGFRPFATMGFVKVGPWRRDFYRTNEREEGSNFLK